MDIVIFIPGRQHADQLSAALIEAGRRLVFHHTSPARPALAAQLAGSHRLHRLIGLAFRLGNRVLPAERAQRFAHRMFAAFDRRVARSLAATRPRVVVGYENGALHTFRTARRLGMTTILDAASVHHRMQSEAGLDNAGTPFRARINAQKDAEIALADHILCCSKLAADSYVAAGVPASRVHTITLGFEPASFMPAADPAPHTGPLRIAFVGRFTRVKGADLLAIALSRLAEQGSVVECRIAARRGDGSAEIAAALSRHARLLGHLAPAALAKLYRWADLLVMPSRFDSFGLVVPEALACGLPVLVSDRVGAGDLITPGVNGDIVPFDDADALTAKLAAFAADPRQVRAMRPAAVAAAHGAEWPHYRTRAAATIAAILDAAPRP
jgi:glycosyltransferase involved in cell wall biosynthesis